jgi:hypothetical protein
MEMKRSLLFVGFGLIALLFFVHEFSTMYYVYWTNGWTDHLTHFIGGAALGFLGLWLCFASGLFLKKTPTFKEAFSLGVLSALVVGVVWEVFEYKTGIVSLSSGYGIDTFGDLLSDVCGGLGSGILGAHKHFYE